MAEVKTPEPEYMGCDSVGDIFAYSESQLKQYGDDRALEALEMAAKVCETQDEVGPSFPNWWECSAGIRALAKEIQQ